MNNITYYFGAGASFNALPVVNEMPKWLQSYYNTIHEYRDQIPGHRINAVDEYLIQLKELINATITGMSVDAYANSLYNDDHFEELAVVKSLLCGFFMYEHASSDDSIKPQYAVEQPLEQIDEKLNTRKATKVDYRYTSFLNEFAKDRVLDKVNIISWNYDMQLELANIRQGTFRESQSNLSAFPTPENCFNKKQNETFVKVNGSAGMLLHKRNNALENIISEQTTTLEAISQAINIFYTSSRFPNGAVPFINFSFEEENYYSTLAINRAKQIMKETEILVVIGYSFEQTNWKVDQKIFSEAEKLKRVYFQVPESSYNDIHAFRLPVIRNGLQDICVPYHNCSKFCIPPELYSPPEKKNNTSFTDVKVSSN